MSNLLKKFYDVFEYNSSTLSGCLDVIVVQKEDGSLHSTPFHVRIGKLKAFNTKLKKIKIFVNGNDTAHYMKLNNEGIGFFEQEMGCENSETEFEASSACFQSDEEIQEVKKEKSSKTVNGKAKPKDEIIEAEKSSDQILIDKRISESDLQSDTLSKSSKKGESGRM